MSQLVIGLVGFSGAGKSTLAAGIADYLDDPECRRISFADPIREVCGSAFGLSAEEMILPELKDTSIGRWPGLTPRRILQVVGTDCFRQQFPGIWLHRWEENADSCSGAVVTDDVRFPDEAALLRARGAKLVYVARAGAEAGCHESEKGISGSECDYVVFNSADTPHEFVRSAIGRLVEWGVLPPKAPSFVPGTLVVHVDDGAVGEVLSVDEGVFTVDFFNIGRMLCPTTELRVRP